MQDIYYSVIGIIALTIHLIVNLDLLMHSDGNGTKAFKCYRRYFFACLSFYLFDSAWGFIYSSGNTKLSFIDTTLYFIAMAHTVFFWCSYVNSYLGISGKYKIIIKTIGRFFCVGLTVVLITNIFKPVLFCFDEHGHYVACLGRYVTLFVQTIIFTITGFIAQIYYFRTRISQKSRTLTICMFSFIMLFAAILQTLLPLIPCYTMGLLIGTVILHVFVQEDEKEEIRRELEKVSKTKSNFLFSMSHDIRTPMNAIIGYADLMEKNFSDTEKCHDYLKKIRSSSDFLLSLINDVLEMSKIESGNESLVEKNVNLAEFNNTVSSVFEDLMKNKNIELTVELNVQHQFIIGDPVKMREILLNLVSNAYKYTPEGGKVSVILTELQCEEEGYCKFKTEVADNGIGMKEEFLPYLFNIFSRENNSTECKIEGTGLGMAIVKKFVDLMGGTISVKSQYGQGTTFTIYTTHKIAEESHHESVIAKEINISTLKGKKILVAEDNALNAEIIQEILKSLEIEAEVAEDGYICTGLVEKAAAGTYYAVLMDIQMPNMTGLEAARAIRSLPDKEKAAVPIIAMTANAYEEDIAASIKAGMNAHISKPIDVQQLILELAKIQNSEFQKPVL